MLLQLKNLSVNNVYLEVDFAERNDPCGEVVEREEAALKFLVSHEQLSKAIEPAVTDLNNPASSLLAGMTLLGFLLLRATGHMRDVAVALDDFQRRLATVSGIQAQMLGATLRWRLALDHDRRQYGIELRDVMPVRSGHDERQGDATSVDQQVPLASIFSPDQSGWVRPVLVPAEP